MLNSCVFKAYDIRGVVPTEIDEEGFRRVVRAYVAFLRPKRVVLGRDVRVSGERIKQVAKETFLECGVDLFDIGVADTDVFYFAVGTLPVDGGITISASHNPAEYNGMNLAREKAIPIAGDSGLEEIRDLALQNRGALPAPCRGSVSERDLLDDFARFVLSRVDVSNLSPAKVVANGNSSMAVEKLRRVVGIGRLPITIIGINDVPDGTFPKGTPDPYRPEVRRETADSVLSEGADLGITWDGDGDRCAFCDETGRTIAGYFITAILAAELLRESPGEKIVIDPRLTWATIDTIRAHGGIPLVNRAGMTLMAARMREENARFGGELSSHFYFRECFNRDNSLLPLLLLLRKMAREEQTLSQIAAPLIDRYHVSEEINLEVGADQIADALAKVEDRFRDGEVDHTDGLSVAFPDRWRFNLRPSNTEPMVRLNVESVIPGLMERKRDELLRLLRSLVYPAGGADG
jgi:phosphomannomutase